MAFLWFFNYCVNYRVLSTHASMKRGCARVSERASPASLISWDTWWIIAHWWFLAVNRVSRGIRARGDYWVLHIPMRIHHKGFRRKSRASSIETHGNTGENIADKTNEEKELSCWSLNIIDLKILTFLWLFTKVAPLLRTRFNYTFDF